MFRRGLLLLSQALILAFWPISFYFNNQPTHFKIFQDSLKQGTVFRVSPLDYDALVKKIGLFPNRNLARLEQNKLTPVISKYSLNFFSLIDTNNYFFGFHPRENVIQNQNLLKFPPLSIIFLLFGLFYWQKLNRHRLIFIAALLSMLFLSFLSVFDGFDLVLYPPIAAIIIHGLNTINEKKSILAPTLLSIFCLISTIDLMRIVLIYPK